MKRSGYSVDIVKADDQSVPSCAHGPTLLFEECKGLEVRRFFACSAFRDRKDCPFYQLLGTKRNNREPLVDTNFAAVPSKQECKNRLEKYRALNKADRAVCRECGLLLLPQDRHLHHTHTLVSPVKLVTLDQPTTLFQRIHKNKSFSQYLFTNEMVEFLVKTLTAIGHSKFLCVGTPRIHEFVRTMKAKGDHSVDSLLLDLDKRFQQVWPDSTFCHYNLFNHHFFEPGDQHVFNLFMVDCMNQPVVIIDPPFGGLVDPIATTLEKISQTSGGDIKVILFFPYFLESRVIKACPTLKMLDYMVDYDNHNLYRTGGRKYGSPVRIFTNITPSCIRLPSVLGYWYCGECAMYRHQNNWHCVTCGSCTSKDGSRYIHCELCGRCVKPSRTHCGQCNQCVTHDHQCGQILGSGCHICGEMSHKRRDCPNQVTPVNKRKMKRKQPRKLAHHGKKLQKLAPFN